MKVILKLQKKIIKEPLSIEDFEYHDFILDEKEAFLLKMRNKEFYR